MKKLFKNQNKILFYDDTSLMMIENGQIINLLTLENQITEINSSDSEIVILSGNQCLIYNSDLTQLINIFDSDTYSSSFNIALVQNNKTYIGTNEKGVLVIDNLTNDFNYLKPDGPTENNIFSVETLNLSLIHI